MDPFTRLYYCTNWSRGCFLLHLKRESWTAFNHLCIMTWWYMRNNSIHPLSILQALSFCLHGFFCCRFVSASTVVPTTDLLFNCFLFGCLSRQLGKEVVSNWHNICNSVLSSSIAVNKYLKSITKCTVSSLDVHRQAVNCSCVPPWLVWKTFCLLFCLL